MRKPWRASFGLAQSQPKSEHLSESNRCYPESVQPNRGNTTVLSSETNRSWSSTQGITSEGRTASSNLCEAQQESLVTPTVMFQVQEQLIRCWSLSQTWEQKTDWRKKSTWEGSLGGEVPRGKKMSDKPIRAPKPIQIQTEKTQEYSGGGLYKAQTLAGLSFLEHVTIHWYTKYS